MVAEIDRDAARRKARDILADACKYLSVARDVVGSSEVPLQWETVVAQYEERLERLPAFRDEAQKAGLLT